MTHFRSFLTSGSRGLGHLACFAVRMFWKVSKHIVLELACFHWVVSQEEELQVLIAAKSHLPLIRYQRVRQLIELSVSGCKQSGKESPPACARVAFCLATATTGHIFRIYSQLWLRR